MKVKINKTWPLDLPLHRARFHAKNPNWEHERLQALHNAITERNNPIVFDIGSEEGDISALMATWGAQVFPIEPSPYYWSSIRDCFKRNHVKPLGYFVGFASNTTNTNRPKDYDDTLKDGWPKCAYSKIRPDFGFRHLNEQTDVTQEVRLEDFMPELWPDIINCDCEGAELYVLQGAARILALKQPKVFVSIHPDFMRDRYKCEPDDVHKLMASHGYEGKLLAEGHEEHWSFEVKR